MTNRFRLRFSFWLDLHKSDEAALAETIDALKQNRTFASTIRDGIRLIADLRAGRIDVLLELFPWVKEALQPAPATSADQRLQEQIERLENLLLAQGNVPSPAAADDRSACEKDYAKDRDSRWSKSPDRRAKPAPPPLPQTLLTR